MLAENSLLIPALPDLIWGTVAFVLIAIAVGKFGWPTFMRILDERTAKIEDGLAAAARAREEIAGEREKIRAEVDEARREAAQIRERAQGTAAGIIASAQKDAQKEAARITEAAQRQITAERHSAFQQLRAEVGGLATTLAERIVGEQVLDSRVSEGVVNRFLDELEVSSQVKEG